MSHISGTFSHAKAGRLRISLTGTFYYGTHRDAGFPSGTATNAAQVNYSVRPFIGPVGSRVYGEPIDRFAPLTQFEVEYPGGSVSWPVGTETVGFVDPIGQAGLWGYGIDNLNLIIDMRKK